MLDVYAQGQSAEVYRWVDEDGNVHFSDMPTSKEAKLFFVKPGNSSAADKAAMSQIQQDESAVQDLGEGNGQLDKADSELFSAPNTAEKCRDLRVEMNKVARDLHRGNQENRRLARMFLDKAEKELQASGCN